MNLAVCFALFLALAVATQGWAEDYYFYEGPKGELVISNKEPPGSKIIKRLPNVTDKEAPQAQEPSKTQSNGQRKDSPKPPRTSRSQEHVSYLGYVITGTANNEKSTWRSHVIVTCYAGKFDLHDESSFTTETEAEEHAIELGKHWVNNRLQSMQG